MLELINHPNEAFEYAKKAYSFATTSLTLDCFHKKIHTIISNIRDRVKNPETSWPIILWTRIVFNVNPFFWKTKAEWGIYF